jgi:hypothetical protein
VDYEFPSYNSCSGKSLALRWLWKVSLRGKGT